MPAQYKPNTPSVRKMFRSIRMADMVGLKEALSEGADPNALHGKGQAPNHLPLDRVLWFHGHDPVKGSLLVATLLEAGARMDKAVIPGRQPPMIQALGAKSAHEEVLRVFVRFSGGSRQFVDALPSDQMEMSASKVLWGGSMEDRSLLSDLFFRIWDRMDAEGVRPKGDEGVPWPWSDMQKFQSLSRELQERIHARVPKPTPQNTFQSVWCKRMISLSRMDEPGFLFKEGLSQTPAKWWFSLYEKAPGVASTNTLAEEILASSFPEAVQEGLRKVGELKGGWDHPEAPSPDLFIRAGAHSAPLLRHVMKAVPKGDHYHALSLALLDVTREASLAGPQRAAIRELLKQDADPCYQDSESRTPLHQVASWQEDIRPGHLLTVANMLMEAGARWDRPKDKFGLSPRDVLAYNNPSLAAQLTKQGMEAEIPEVASRNASNPRPRPGRL